MSYMFSSTELEAISNKLDSARAGTGSYASVYAEIFSDISTVGFEGPKLDVDVAAWSWVKGALQVNQGIGSYSEFIRGYSAAEYETRYGHSSTTSLQDTSDAVCDAVASDILSSGTLPSLHSIGLHDAGETIANYFEGDAAGWSGNLLFTFLGDTSFYQSTILEVPGDTYDWAVSMSSAATAFSNLSSTDDLVSRLSELISDNGLGTIDTANATLALVTQTSAFIEAAYHFDAADIVFTYGFIVGTKNSDELFGDVDANYINAGPGNDIVNADQDTDIVDGGSGNDILIGGAQRDKLFGSSGNDVIVGGDADETTLAADMASPGFLSTFHAEWNDGARDYIYGGDGTDTINVCSSSITQWAIYKYEGKLDLSPDIPGLLRNVDVIDGSDSDYIVNAQIGFSDGDPFSWFAFSSSTVSSALSAGPDIDGYGYTLATEETSVLDESGHPYHLSAYGMRFQDAELGPVLMVVGEIPDCTGIVAAITISRNLGDTGGQWTIFGSDPDDPATAGTTARALDVAGTGDDILYAGNAQEDIYAFGGNDIIITGSYNVGADYFDGGDGVDTVDYSGSSANITVDISATTGTVTGLGSGNGDTLLNIENINTGSGADTVTGSAVGNVINTDGGNDIVGGGGGNDTIYGGTGNDSLAGGSGNDVLYGGNGNDTLVGAGGNDSFYVNVAADVVTEASGGGTDVVYSSAGSYTLSAYVENLTLLDGATSGVGNNLSNILTGNSADNQLDGSTGADTMIGGLGDDTYTVDNASDVITENASEGTDLVNASVTYTLVTNVENLTLTGTADINGIGNATANIINGNGGDNNLSGGGSADTLSGGAGSDTLSGGNGNDILAGGSGMDTLAGGLGTDTFRFTTSSGKDTITDFTAGSGGDIIDLSAVSEIVSFSNLKNQHTTDMGSYLVLSWDNGAETVTLNGVANITDLVANNFIFA